MHGYDFNFPVFSKYFRTVVYDERGHGLSSKPEPESAYGFEVMAEDLYQLLKHLGVDSCYLVGQAAIGIGQIFTFFVNHPEMVKGLIPVSGGFPSVAGRRQAENESGMSTGQLSAGRYLREVARERGMLAVLEERKKNMYLWTQRILETPEIMSRFEVMYQQTSPYVFLHYPEQITEERYKEIVDKVEQYKVPILQIVGLEDPDPVRVINQMKNVNRRAQAAVIPESGHYPAIENPYDFNTAILNFIAGIRQYGNELGPE
jgi:pimeloyl-ACP methyl ester carboxylesterase